MANNFLKKYFISRGINYCFHNYKIHYVDNERILMTYCSARRCSNDHYNNNSCCCIYFNENKLYFSFLDNLNLIEQICDLESNDSNSVIFGEKRENEIKKLYNKYLK
jgi:hypothetical protein